MVTLQAQAGTDNTDDVQFAVECRHWHWISRNTHFAPELEISEVQVDMSSEPALTCIEACSSITVMDVGAAADQRGALAEVEANKWGRKRIRANTVSQYSYVQGPHTVTGCCQVCWTNNLRLKVLVVLLMECTIQNI